MSETGIAKIFMHGRSQAVRIPKEFRLPGDRVRVRRMGRGILIEPIEFDVDAWLAELDRLQREHGEFLEGFELPPDPPVEPEDIFP